MYVEIPRDWVSGRSTSITSEAGLMYSPALVTSQNTVKELGYGAKTMSQKGKVPNSMGQQSCFSFSKKNILTSQNNLHKISFFKKNQNFFFSQKKTKKNFKKKEAVDVDMTTSLKPRL